MRPVKFVSVLLAVLAALGASGCGGGAKRAASPSRIAAHRVATGTFGSAPQERAAGPSPDYHPTGPIIADDGFRPAHDGFTFPNYGGEAGAVDLTPGALEEIYGPGVCASGVGSSCLLTPVAQSELEQLNGFMTGGHCYGFSVMALRFFKRIADPSIFGAPAVPALNIQYNNALQTAIAEAFISQAFDPVIAARITAAPNQLLDALIAALRTRQEVYTMGIYKDATKQIGHAITPYAVEDKGGGRFAALTYDNNHPLITRAVMFDRTSNSWGYDAASNPNDPTWHFAGDSTSLTMSLDPLTPGLGPQTCFFCGTPNPTGAAAAKSSALPAKGYQQIALEGDPSNHSHLLITDSKGRTTGYVNGRLVTGIPGSKAIVPYADQVWKVRPEPIYRIPAGVKVSVKVEGAPLARPVVENVSLVSQNAAAVVKGLRAGPGRNASIDFGAGAASVRYHAGNLSGAAPIVQLARATSGPDFAVSFKAPVLKNGSTLTVALDSRNMSVSIAAPSAAPTTGYGLRLNRFTALGRQDFTHGGLSLAPGSSAQLKFRSFDRSGKALPFSTRKGHVSRTTELSG